jgi:signal transduction histidine kinase
MQPSEGAGILDPLPAAPGTGASHLEHDLLSSVCHDLKVPLASIVMGVGLLRRVLRPEEDVALRVVETMHRSADRLTQLITTFHDLGRLQSQALALNLLPHDVGAIARAAFDQFIGAAKAQNVPASFECGSGDLRASCDRDRLMQAVHLLAVCALRILPEGGSITLRVDAEANDAVRVRVQGDRGGPGCRPIVAELPKPELAIAKGLVDLHHARLDLTGDDSKVVLLVTLPRHAP